MDAGPGPGSIAALDGAQPRDWQFLQCFGERTPGEEIQEGVEFSLSRKRPLDALTKKISLAKAWKRGSS